MERIQYSDRLKIASGENVKERDYWQKKLAGKLVKTNFPYDNNKSGEDSNERCFNCLEFCFDGNIFKELEKITNHSDYTLNIILITGLVILLHKYTDSQDIIIGTPIYKQEMSGTFLNTLLPLRIQWNVDLSFKELLLHTRQVIDEAEEHQNYPLEFLFDQLKIPYSENHDFLLMDNLILLENIHDKEYIKHVNVNMVFTFARKENRLNGGVEYNPLLYEPATVERIVKYWHNLFQVVLFQYNLKISQLDLLLPLEKEQLLSQLNHTGVPYPENATITRLFEEQVERTPHKIAVMFEDYSPCLNRQITYQDLNKRANGLARVLGIKGVTSNQIVGLMLELSSRMMVSILAVLKAGGAYLPIDPDFPASFTLSIIEDANISILLTGNTELEKKPSTFITHNRAREIMKLDTPYKGDMLAEFTAGLNISNPNPINRPTDLAYIISTSGSTGRPKGVMIEHKNVVRLLFNEQNLFDFCSHDVWTMSHSYCFDFSVWEMYGAFLYGGELIVLEIMISKDPKKTRQILKKKGVTILSQTPLAFYGLVNEEQKHPGKQLRLRYVFIGGEALKEAKLKEWKEKYPRSKLVNGYGPTETTVFATVKEITDAEIASNKGNIGKPLPTLGVYVMSGDSRLKPIGISGELFIGGKGVGRGYLNRPELTNEKYFQNPFQPGDRLYRSGDLVRLSNNGDLEYLGRIDKQVKIRGFRIELGEIESQLIRHENIKEAAVLMHEKRKVIKEEDENKEVDNNKYLCAYIVPRKNFPDAEDTSLNASGLRQFLSHHLPDYMIPSLYIPVEKIPLTVNGKIDFDALPRPLSRDENTVYNRPQNEIEIKLTHIWQDILGIEKIGIDDNFIQLGGDSIKAIQVSARLQDEGLTVETQELFINQTIRELAPYVKKSERSIDQGPVKGRVELSPIQKWFFEHHDSYLHHFNHSVMLLKKDGFQPVLVEKVFKKITNHHDALRMVFTFEGNHVQQYNRGIDQKAFALKIVDLKNVKEQKVISQKIKYEANNIQASMHLINAPLVKLGLFKTTAGDHLLIVIHHLVIDGVSWRILLEDFLQGYQQAEQEKEIKFPNKTDSYKYWVEQLKEYSASSKALQELPYWQQIQESAPRPLPMDFELSHHKKKVKYYKSLTITLSERDTGKLLKEVNQAYNTEINDILLTALGLAVKEWKGIQRILINLEGHGREEIIKKMDISRTIGWFTSQFPVILDFNVDPYRPDTGNRTGGDLPGDEVLGYTIKATKENLRKIPGKGIVYNILKYLTPREKCEGVNFSTAPGINFNYLGQLGPHRVTGNTSAEDTPHINITLSNQDMGRQISQEFYQDCLMDINGIITGNKLSLMFSYNQHAFKKESIQKFVRAFKRELLKIIEHCIGKEKELTPSDLVDGVELSIGELKDIMKQRVEIEKIYPLSPMQEGMLVHSLMDKHSQAYPQQGIFNLNGDIDSQLLEKSINRVIHRYEILRTIYRIENVKKSVQIILKKRRMKLHYKDVSHLNREEKKQYLEEIIEKESIKGFDLTRDLLMRVLLFRTGKATYMLIWSFHHIVLDGWCLGIIFKDLIQIYHSLKEARPLQLKPVTPYRHYIKWVGQQNKEEGLKFWKDYLQWFVEPTGLPKLTSPGKIKQEWYYHSLSASTTEKIVKTAKKNRVTLNTVFQAIWALMLFRYNNTNRIVFGQVVSGRPPEIPGIESMVGLFINTIPFGIIIDENETFDEFLREVQQKNLSTKPYQYLPLADVMAASPLKDKLFDHVFGFENYPLDTPFKHIDTANREIQFNTYNEQIREQSTYDYSIEVIPGKTIMLKTVFKPTVLEKDFVKKIISQFAEIIELVISSDKIQLKDMVISSTLSQAKSGTPFSEYFNYEY